MRFYRPFLCLLLVSPLAAPAMEFKPFLSVDARGGGAGVDGPGGASSLILGQILAVPALKLNDQDTLTLTGLLSSTSADHVIAEDSFFTNRATAILKPSWRHNLDESTKTQWRATAMHGSNLENPTQKWLTNPYDFEEYSTGLGLSREGQLFGQAWSSGLGFDYLHRGYPNYRELTGSFNDGKNVATKDYNGYKLSAESRHKLGDKSSARLALSSLFKSYVDSYLVTNQGTLDLGPDQKRNESTLTLSADGDLPAWGDARIDGGLELQTNSSNQNYFDAGTPKYIENYYSYNSFSFSPTLRMPIAGASSGHSMSVGYQFTLRAFGGRLARAANGEYRSEKQVDTENAFNLDGRYALASHWSVVGGGGLRLVGSNNAFDLGARNSYTLYTLNLGMEFKL